jgi:2-keto-3-deoxy-L-fuconate dehydrogenase
MLELTSRVAAVTGGGSGIGQAIAELFAERGANVQILDRDEGHAEATVSRIVERGGKAKYYGCDVSSQDSVDDVFEKIGQTGPVEILVNNAGVSHIGNVENTSEEDFDRIFRVNVKGLFHCIRAAIPQMKANGGGTILNMASIAASVGLSDRFAYSMSKGAVVAMTYSVAKDYIADNIRCNCLSPARVHTTFVDNYLTKYYPGKEAEMFQKLAHTQPIGRMAEPAEIAQFALFLCSDEAAFITGTDYPIDGGFLRLNT